MVNYFYRSQVVSFAGDSRWHDLLTSCYSGSPSPGIARLVDARFRVTPFDDDKVNLVDLSDAIVNNCIGIGALCEYGGRWGR